MSDAPTSEEVEEEEDEPRSRKRKMSFTQDISAKFGTKSGGLQSSGDGSLTASGKKSSGGKKTAAGIRQSLNLRPPGGESSSDGEDDIFGNEEHSPREDDKKFSLLSPRQRIIRKMGKQQSPFQSNLPLESNFACNFHNLAGASPRKKPLREYMILINSHPSLFSFLTMFTNTSIAQRTPSKSSLLEYVQPALNDCEDLKELLDKLVAKEKKYTSHLNLIIHVSTSDVALPFASSKY